MAEDERIEEESAATKETGEDVEAHGIKEVAGVGLAAAALLGAGATVAELTGDDEPSQRIEAALISRDVAASLARADRDRDGYVNSGDLSLEGFKYSAEELIAEGIDVTPEGLAAAGTKVQIDVVGREGGFPVISNTIVLRSGIDAALDELAKGSALEWTKKLKEIDRDGDGYAGYDELAEVGMKMDTALIKDAGFDVSAEELAKAGYKLPLETFGEGGFVTKEDMVMMKFDVDPKLDALIKGELKP